MKDGLIKKLYYTAGEMRELECAGYNELIERAEEVSREKAEDLKRFAPAAMVEALQNADLEQEEIVSQRMFLLGLKSAVILLEEMSSGQVTGMTQAKESISDVKMHLSTCTIQAAGGGPGKVIDWSAVHKELDSVVLDVQEYPDNNKNHIIPALPDKEYKELCNILNNAYLGLPVKKTDILDHLRSHIFKDSISVDCDSVKELGTSPFVMRMQMVPVIASVKG